MDFELDTGRNVLARTPGVLDSLLRDLPDSLARRNEGSDTWSPFDVVGHLIHGEKTDWIPRARIILEHGPRETFEPFDRFAQFEASAGKSLNQLLGEFSDLRGRNLSALDELALTPDQLKLEGRHPEFGVVTLKQLLATWVAHDLGHIAQIVRTMARLHGPDADPWRAYLRILG